MDFEPQIKTKYEISEDRKRKRKIRKGSKILSKGPNKKWLTEA